MTRSPSAVLAYGRGELSEPIVEQTIGDALRAAAALHGPRTALVEGTLAAGRRRWSYDQLLAKAEQTARALLGRFSPGERVAVWAGNCPEWVFLELGAALAGLTLVTVNPAYLGKEAAYVLGKSRASGVIVQPVYRGRDLLENLSKVKEELPALREVISLADWDAFLAAAGSATPLPEMRPGDAAQIQYTSGTTGFPKGAQLTHRGLANNARLYAHVIGAGPADIWVNPMPLFHTAGCGLGTLGPLQAGGTQILPPSFDAERMLALLEAEHGTIVLAVPTMLNRMLDHPNV
jgi:fatty-acyl-CoA synthase